jgi:hypothetical protein
MDCVLHCLVVDKKERSKQPDGLTTKPLWTLVKRCWHAEPNARPTFVIIQADLKQLMDSSVGSGEVVDIEDVNRLTAMHNCGVTYYHQDRPNDGEVLFKWLLASREKVLSTEHEDTLTTMFWVACVYEHQQRYDDVETLLRWVLAV